MNQRVIARILVLALVTVGCQATAEEPVRKAKDSDICHDMSSSSYQRLKYYTPYPTLEACLAAGGRLPKDADPSESRNAPRHSKAIWNSDDQTIVKKSRSGICYDSSDGRFGRTVHFTAYRTMRDCLDDGGRPPD
jgi:hypothetical protein